MTQYVIKFTKKGEQLEAADVMIPKELLSIMLLESLPPAYDNFSVAIVT